MTYWPAGGVNIETKASLYRVVFSAARRTVARGRRGYRLRRRGRRRRRHYQILEALMLSHPSFLLRNLPFSSLFMFFNPLIIRTSLFVFHNQFFYSCLCFEIHFFLIIYVLLSITFLFGFVNQYFVRCYLFTNFPDFVIWC